MVPDSMTASESPGLRRRALRMLSRVRLPRLGYYQWLFAAYVGVLLAVFLFFVPPFQKSDEPAHWHRAVAVTNLDLTCDTEDDPEPYFAMKRKYGDLPDVMRIWEVATDYNNKFRLEWLKADFSAPHYDQTGRIYLFCGLPAAGYVPNAAGILLGKPFENPLVSFYLGRIFGALFFLGCVITALRVAPSRYQPVIYFYAAIPMVLHQVSAISYDAVHLSLGPLIFAYLSRFLVDGAIRRRDLLIFLALIVWIINIRLIVYYPLVLLFFLLPHGQVARPVSRYLLAAAAFHVVAALTVALSAATYLPNSGDAAPPEWGIDAPAQTRFVLNHPDRFIAASYNVIEVYGESLLKHAIGQFGWLDYTMSFAVYYVVVFAAGIFIYRFVRDDVALLRPLQLVVLSGVIFLTVGLLFFSLYATWSPPGSDLVSGLQGRYFLILLPFGLFLASQLAAAVGRARLLRLLLLGLAVFIFASVVSAIDSRYYDYG